MKIEKNYLKLKKANVNLSAIVNDFIDSHEKKFLELEFNEVLENIKTLKESME